VYTAIVCWHFYT